MDLFSIEKTNVTGNPAILNDSAKMALQGLTVYGRSNQTKTTGAQLFCPVIDNISMNNVTVQFSDSGKTMKAVGTATASSQFQIGKPIVMSPGEEYTYSADRSNGFENIWIESPNKIQFGWWGKNISNRSTFTVPDTVEEKTECIMYASIGKDVYYNFILNNPMLNKGTTALPWEPYTGAKVSPSLEYPQEITNAKPELYFTGKNLIDYIDIEWERKGWQGWYKNENRLLTVCAKHGWCNLVFESPVQGKQVTLSVTYRQIDTNDPETNVNYAFSIMSNNDNAYPVGAQIFYKISSPSTEFKRVSATFISQKYIGFFMKVSTEGQTAGLYRTIEIKDIQLELGSTATPYKSYPPPQSLTLNLNNGLPGIPVSSDGNYTDDTGQQWICDEVDLERGIYVQRVYSIIVDGEDVTFSQAGRYCNMNLKKLPNAKTISGMSQMAEARSTFTSETWNFNQEMGFLYLIKENYAETINEFCKEHGGEVMYALATPIKTPLTDSDIATYNSIRTYDGTTVVRATDDIGLSVTYGRKINMANTTLKTRIILNNKTTDEWAQAATFVGLKGEFLVDSSTRKIKIGDGATAYPDLPFVNLTPEEVDSLIKAASHSHSNKDVLDATTASFTTALLEKLNGIATGANKTVVDSALSSTSTNPVQNKVVNSALGGKVPTSRKVNGKALSGDITLSAGDVDAIPTSARGAKNGVASLDENGKVPAAQLPSYVDDVLEGYVADDLSAFYKDSGKTSAYTPETGKIYVNLNNNKTYRYSGSKYAVISETLALGETSSTAFDGARGKKAYDHSQSAHAPSNAERNIIVGIQKNGADVTVDSNRKVNITVPTKTSEITNDSGFITSGATTAKAKQLETARKIDGVNFDGTADITHYGICSTAAGTAAKTVAVTGFNLVTGARVTVKFTVTNTAASPTLNVNGTGAKAIKYRGSTISTGYLAANRVYEFVYDGTDYLFMGDINIDTNTTYKAGTGITIGSGNAINHTNSVTAGTVKGDDSKTLGFGSTFKVPSITYDAQGHITSTSTTTMTMPATPTTVSGNAGSATKLATARNFSITGGATASAISFNGTADVALNVTSLNAAKLTIASSDTLILDGTI